MSIFSAQYSKRPLFIMFTVVVVFALGAYVLHLPELVRLWFINLAWTFTSLTSGLVCLAVARKLDGSDQTAWRFYGYGCLLWFLGMLIWSYNELVLQHSTPFPALSDIGFLGLAPLFLLGLMSEFTRMTGKKLSLKNISDIGLIVSVVSMTCLIGFSDDVLNPVHSLRYRITALAFPVLYLSIFVYALLALSQHADRPDRNVLFLLLASLGMHAILSSLYANSLFERTYATGHMLDIFWIIAFGLIYLAATQKLRVHHNSNNVTYLDMTSERVRSAEIIIFAATALSICIVALIKFDEIEKPLLTLLLPYIVLAVFFLSLREWAIFRLERQVSGELRRSELELSKILESLQDTFFRVDMQGRITRLSPSVTQLSGYEIGELINQPVNAQLVSDEHYADMKEKLAEHGHLDNLECPLLHKNGTTIWVLLNAQYLYDSDKRPIGMEGTIRNITARKLAEAEMDKLSRALKQTADMVMMTDRNGVIEYVNPAFCEITGYDVSEVIGNRPSILKSGKQPAEFYRRLWQTVLRGETFSDVFVNKRRDNSLFYESKTITPIIDQAGEITHFISTGKDISEQMQTQKRLNFMAHHDVLTELPNRALFLDRVKQALARARWHQRRLAIMFMDIDSFKYINDSLGHEVGDRLLIEIAQRLFKNLRDGDTIARFGGDEFVILLDDIARETDVTSMAHKLLETLRPTFNINGLELHITASIGISLYPNDGDEAQTLLRNADNAMYRAKETGKNTFKFYSTDMSVRAFERLTLENSLRHALTRKEFVLYYQPQVDITHSRILGVEALLRWQHPDFGLLAPGDFIPILEETGLIVPVGEWVLEQASSDLLELTKHANNELSMAINISARQLNDPGFDLTLARVIKHCQLTGSRLQLEMTESVLMRYSTEVVKTLTKLRRQGISLALDDFGTGYSSLSYLKRYPIDTLKIDRSFIRDVTTNRDDAALTTAIIAMAKSLNLQVIAEGVENVEQLAFLLQQACGTIQGYLICKPAPIDTIKNFIAAHHSNKDWSWLDTATPQQ